MCVSDENFANLDPFHHLERLVAAEKLSADLLLCAGDMADRGCRAGLRHVWGALHRLAAHLGDARLLTVPGNHDLDSRFEGSGFDPKGALLGLQPRLPIGDERLDDHFWARNFAVVAENAYRVLLLNSAAYHGYMKENEAHKEHEHGRISKATLAAIRDALNHTGPRSVNIVLCHHHPMANNDVGETDYSEMSGGHDLVNLLSEDDAEWMMVHGHKHYPRIAYATGTGAACLVFGAGSFSARLYSEAATKTRNQFYIVEFEYDQDDSLPPLKGRIHAWDYSNLDGWKRSPASSVIPYNAGFGFRDRPIAAVDTIMKFLNTSGKGVFVEWGEICQAHPELAHLLPLDRTTVARRLGERSVNVNYDDWGNFAQLFLKETA